MTDLDQRQPRVREAPYLAWIARLPCVACMCEGLVNCRVHVAHVRFADAEAGWRGVGMQEKPDDRRTLPLCPPHHVGDARKTSLTQHAMSERAFYESLRIDAPALCAALAAAYDAGQPGAPIIARFAGQARRTSL